MEELLIAIICALGEVCLEIIAYLPWDSLLCLAERKKGRDGQYEWPLLTMVAIGAFLGLLSGAFSVHVAAHTMLPYAWMRIGNIVAAPVVAARLARWAAKRRVARGLASSPRHHFAFAYSFTLILVLVRFVQAIRPS